MIKIISKNLKALFFWGLLLALVSAVASMMLFISYYSAVSDVLIVFKNNSGVDPYTRAKAAEQAGQDLTQIIKSENFYQLVDSLGNTEYNKSRWQGLSPRERRKQWQKAVAGSLIYNTGILRLTVYSITPADTAALANAVTQTLINNAQSYIGGDATLKIINNPLVSRWPTRPNLAINGSIGFLVGILLSVLWVSKKRV